MIKAKQPAFPCNYNSELSNGNNEFSGLTKREYFAGLAMQSLLMKRNFEEAVAQIAVECADGLLKQLEKK